MAIRAYFPTNDANAVGAKMKDILTADAGVTAAGVKTIYDYRTFPALTAVEVSISNVRDTAVAYKNVAAEYDYVVSVLVRHDGTETSKRTAELTLTNALDAIWNALIGADKELWRDLYPYKANEKPGSPPELPQTRLGYAFVRVEPI